MEPNRNGSENGNSTAEVFESLLDAFEKYRELENRAVKKIKEQLAEKGIEIPEEQIKEMDRNAIRERLFETRERRIRAEQEAEKADAERTQEPERKQGPGGLIR